jgi:hypothetical protein
MLPRITAFAIILCLSGPSWGFPDKQQNNRQNRGQKTAKFRKGNMIGLDTRWKPGQSGNPAGRPLGPGFKNYGWGGGRSSRFRPGVSGNPAGRPPGTGWRQRAEELCAARGWKDADSKAAAAFFILWFTRGKQARHALGF